MYEPLDPSRREIRLLEISSQSDDGLIQCRLHTVSLDDADLEFAALSYVWGDESITRDILVEGQQRTVTTNLESALQNFRHYFVEKGDDAIARAKLLGHVMEDPHGLARLRRVLASETCDLHHGSDADDESDADDDEDCVVGGDGVNNKMVVKNAIMMNRIISACQRARVGFGGLLVWIDALCINQDDLVEKSQQIPMMRDIFGKAACVFSWLGPSDHRNIDFALSTIRKIEVSLRSGRSSWSRFSQRHPELCVIQYPFPGFNDYWRAIGNFAGSEYFQRLWIFQELWAANNAIFLCGDEYLLADTLLCYHNWALSVIYDDNCINIPPTVPVFNPIAQVYKMKHESFQGMLVKTRAFLSIVGGWRCKDPRDNVFALMGIFEFNIAPNYAMSVADVYAAWVTESYRDSPLGSLLFHSGIGLFPQPLESRSLPSWQPDFGMVNEQVSSCDTEYAYRYLDVEVPDRFQPTLSLSQTKSLTCFGIHVAHVREIATHASKRSVVRGIDSGINGVLGFQPLLSVLRYLIDGERRLWDQPYVTKGSRLWAFVQTVNECTHRWWDDEGVPPPSDLTLGILRALSPCNLFEEIWQQITELSTLAGTIPGPGGFTVDDLKFLGFQSVEQLWDCLKDLHMDLEDRANLPPGPGLTAETEHPLPEFVTRLRIFARDKSIFYTDDGFMGAGPPGMETRDLVYLIHGCSLPVLLREVEGQLRHVGVCYISDFAGAEGLQVLKDRECDVREVNIV